jgi:hypothetical protein
MKTFSMLCLFVLATVARGQDLTVATALRWS